jgi:hypothetical protein
MNINSQRKINILWSGKLRDEKDEAEYILLKRNKLELNPA